MLNTAGEAAAHQTYTFAWASTPGILLALVAIVTGLIYGMSLGHIFRVLWANVKKLRFAMLTIGSVVALAYVMGDSGQTLALGLFFAGAGMVYPFVAPVLGWIGVYVTGSDTSANILFSGLQSGVGAEIGPGSHLGTRGHAGAARRCQRGRRRRRQDDLAAVADRRRHRHRHARIRVGDPAAHHRLEPRPARPARPLLCLTPVQG